MMKRAFDIVVASFGLVVLSPMLVLAAALIKLDSPGPVFFRQSRVGRNFEPFCIYKLRTMVVDAPKLGSAITCGEDPRITRIGRRLRKLKLDEFPQLINVVKGEMSLVGPRPEVPMYVEMFREDYADILNVRPGITDLSSLKYASENDLLGKAEDPELEYRTRILPDKIAMSKQYISQASVAKDIAIIFRTLKRVFA